MLALIVATHVFYPQHAWLERYDVLFLAAVAIQILMLATKLETIDEAKVICAFHVVGTVMELHKTAIGSWIYPGASLFHIAGVPLFTGFMTRRSAAIAPASGGCSTSVFGTIRGRLSILSVLAAAIYLNFIVDTDGFDMRWGPIGATIILFARTTIFFKIWRNHRVMPLLLGFTLVALFIWFAENIGTFTGTWLYPRQMVHRTLVPASKRPRGSS